MASASQDKAVYLPFSIYLSALSLLSFKNCIQIVRDLDYAVDNEENENGVICVASALTSRSGEAKYAFSISTLTSRVTKKRMQELVSAVLETKHIIEERI